MWLLVAILLFIIAVICYHYAKHRSKQKKCWHTGNIKVEKNNKLKAAHIKNCTCYYFNDIIKIEDFDFNSILLVEQSYKNILIHDVLYKTFLVAKPLCIIFYKVGLLEI